MVVNRYSNTSTNKNRLIVSGLTIWFVGVIAGWAMLTRYSTAACSLGEINRDWPVDIPLSLTPDTAVMMFAHPQCPCTRASITELERLMMTTNRRATVVFWQPNRKVLAADVLASWTENELVQLATDSDHLKVHFDTDDRLANAFDAETSGLCVIHSLDGRVLFRGGITPSRGHEGSSSAQRTMAKCIEQIGQASSLRKPTEQLATEIFPVFGCQI